jgi:hypothetical protein
MPAGAAVAADQWIEIGLDDAWSSSEEDRALAGDRSREAADFRLFCHTRLTQRYNGDEDMDPAGEAKGQR